MKDLEVLVVGAGIGGLSTALALASDGHEVTVIESVKEFLEVSLDQIFPPLSPKTKRPARLALASVSPQTRHA